MFVVVEAMRKESRLRCDCALLKLEMEIIHHVAVRKHCGCDEELWLNLLSPPITRSAMGMTTRNA